MKLISFYMRSGIKQTPLNHKPLVVANPGALEYEPYQVEFFGRGRIVLNCDGVVAYRGNKFACGI